MYKCTRSKCEVQFDCLEEFKVHSSYHDFHAKIKKSGELELEKLEKRLNQSIECPLGSYSDDTINFPPLPTTLVCRWSCCNERFVVAEIFYKHVALHAQDISFRPGELRKCQWIDCTFPKSFRTMTLLKEHLRVHTLEKMYACPKCGNFFSSKIKFADHFLRHLKLPRYRMQEPIDTKRAKIDGVETNIETYSVEGLDTKLYKCTHRGCEQMFPTSSLLREHVRNHSNAYRCNLCSFNGRSASSLKSHKIYRHATERVYECSLCPANFKQINDLRRHVKTHQIPTEPFVCDRCDFQTQSEDSFNRHIKLHQQPNNYLCHVCSKLYCRGSNLSRHLITMHKYSLPDGQSKFKYRQLSDGCYLLDTGDDMRESQTQ